MGGSPASGRHIGLIGATTIGVGGIVGGGILVLAGPALSATGPGAVIAFGLNAVLAVITALAFAELATAIPESGGVYTFAKHVLNVRAAFAVGWIVWFAYIVAAALYALGFASYFLVALRDALRACGLQSPVDLGGRGAAVAAAVLASGIYTLSLIRKATAGGVWETWGKVVLFAVLITVGLATLADRPVGAVAEAYHPILPAGFGGLMQAMGVTFIALQGFDLITAVGGEVKNPRRTIPRAMLYSLLIAVVIYLPLLFVVTTVGTPSGTNIAALSEQYPDTVIAVAAGHFMGPLGYWLVVCAALLGTLSALQANLMAASRIAASMARDRTLPSILGKMHSKQGTPVMAIYASELTLVVILLIMPDVASAGAAASLIFLICFALVHWMSMLARKRVAGTAKAFRAPLFPLLPILGGVACALLALFQGVTVPAAGAITVLWLGLGGILYVALFASRAQAMDASMEALNPNLLRLRGRTPLVLVPVVNPRSAAALIDVGHCLVPPGAGKVLLLTIIAPIVGPEPWKQLQQSQEVVSRALRSALQQERSPEALLSMAQEPWSEIARIVEEHRCENLVLGLGESGEVPGGQLEELLNRVNCDVTFLRVPDGFVLANVQRILVPVGGRGGQHELRSRLLGSLGRERHRQVTFLGVSRSTESDAQLRQQEAGLARLAEDEAGEGLAQVVRSENVAAAVASAAANADLMILGLQTVGSGRKVFGSATRQILSTTSCPAILISRGT